MPEGQKQVRIILLNGMLKKQPKQHNNNIFFFFLLVVRGKLVKTSFFIFMLFIQKNYYVCQQFNTNMLRGSRSLTFVKAFYACKPNQKFWHLYPVLLS
jgi:hypothetical protein